MNYANNHLGTVVTTKSFRSSKSTSNLVSSSNQCGSLPVNLNTVCTNKKNVTKFLNYNQMSCGKFFGYRTVSHFGFNSPQFPHQSHFHIPLTPSKYIPLRRSKSMDEIFATDKNSEDNKLKYSPNLIMKIKKKLNFPNEPVQQMVQKYKIKPIMYEDTVVKCSNYSSFEIISENNQNVRIPSDDLDEFKEQEALAEISDDEVMEDKSDEMTTSSLVTMTIEAVIARMIDPSPEVDKSLIKNQLTPIKKNLLKIIDTKLAEKSLLMQNTFLQKLQEMSFSKVSPFLIQNTASSIKNELAVDENLLISPEKQKVFSEFWNNIPYIDFEMEVSASATSVVLQINEDEHQIENESIIDISSEDSCTLSVYSNYSKENVLNESNVDKNIKLMTSSDSCVNARNFSFSTPTHSINNLFVNENIFNFGSTSLSGSEDECVNKTTPTTSKIPVRSPCGSSTNVYNSENLINRLSTQSNCSKNLSGRQIFTRFPLEVLNDNGIATCRKSTCDQNSLSRESGGSSFNIRRSITKSINKKKRNFVNENIARFSNPKKGNPSSIFSSGNPFNDDDGSVSTFEKKKTSKDNSLWLSFSSPSANKKRKENTPKSVKVMKPVQRPLDFDKTKLAIDEIMMAQQKIDQNQEESRIKELDDLNEIHKQLSQVCSNSGAEEPECNLKQCNNDLENIFRMHQEIEIDRQQQRSEMDAKNSNDLNFLRGITLNLSENDD